MSSKREGKKKVRKGKARDKGYVGKGWVKKKKKLTLQSKGV